MSRMKPATSVGLHQVQGVYKWSSSTSWTEVYKEGKGGRISNKHKTRSDHSRNESSTRWAIFSIGKISLLVCTLSPPAFLPSSFLSPAQQIENIALIRYFPCPFRFWVHSAHDAHHPPFGAGTGIPPPGIARGCIQFALQWHLTSSS